MRPPIEQLKLWLKESKVSCDRDLGTNIVAAVPSLIAYTEHLERALHEACELGHFRLLEQTEDNLLSGTKAGMKWIANHERVLLLQSVMPTLTSYLEDECKV